MFIPTCTTTPISLLISVFIIQHNPTELVSITHDRSTVSHKKRHHTRYIPIHLDPFTASYKTLINKSHQKDSKPQDD